MLRFVPTHRINFRRVYATGKKREDGYSCQKDCDPRCCASRCVLSRWKSCHGRSTPETMALLRNDSCWLKVCIVSSVLGAPLEISPPKFNPELLGPDAIKKVAGRIFDALLEVSSE